MQSVEHTHESQYGMQPAGECVEAVPMHPDDFTAHLAWVIAKRFHELVMQETCAEKPQYRRIIG
jgi:hypothetical protein